MSAEIFGAKELQDRMRQAISSYPDEAGKTLKRIGNNLKKRLKDASPDGKIKANYKSEQARKKAIKYKLKNRWKSKLAGYGEEMRVEVWSKAPHFHLVERGHKMVTRSGKPAGFIAGRFFKEKVSQTAEGDLIPEEMEKFAKGITKKLGGG